MDSEKIAKMWGKSIPTDTLTEKIEKLSPPSGLRNCPTCGGWWEYDPNRAATQRVMKHCPGCGK